MADMENQDRLGGIYQRALEIIWLAVIFLIPLFFNPQSYTVFIFNKALLLEFLVIAMLALWVASWIQSPTSHRNLNWRNIFTSPLHLSILVFGLIVALSTVTSITPAISFWGSWNRKAGLLTLLCWILFFLIVAQQLRHRAQIFRAIYTLLLSSGIVAVIGILQCFFPDAMLKVLQNPYTFGDRVYSTIGNPLFLSSFLTMVIPFNLALIAHSWNRRKEGNSAKVLIVLVILLALQFWCLWLAQYSITILLYIIAPIIFITLLGIVKRKRLMLSLGALSLIALGIIAGSLLLPLLSSTPSAEVTEPEELESAPASEGIGLNTLAWRVQYWRSTIDIITKSPEVPFSNDSLHSMRKVIGYGPETFTVTFQLFFPEDLRSNHVYRSLFVDRPHNDYLYLATTIGLLGLMSFLSILAVFFYLCVHYLRRATADIDKLLLIAMVAAMAQYMADIFFNLSTISPEIVFWLMLAMAFAMGRFIRDGEPVTAEPEGAVKTRVEVASYAMNRRFLLSLVCAVVLIAAGTVVAVKPFLADMYLHKGLKLQSAGGKQPLQAYITATEIEPGEATYWHALGGYSYYAARHVTDEPLQNGLLVLAAGAYGKAAELRQYIAYEYYSLADVYTYWAKKGATDKWPIALSFYDKASQLFPDNAVILNKWALALILKGDLDEARTKLDYSASIDPDWAETCFFSGLLLAKEGENDEASLKLTAPIQNNPANLNYFIDMCTQLTLYDAVSPLRDSLKIHAEKVPDDWITHALLGIASLFDNNVEESLDELNTAMSLVPDNDAGHLFQAILRLSAMSAPFKKDLPTVAAGWRDKLAQSQDGDMLLPMLDQLVKISP